MRREQPRKCGGIKGKNVFQERMCFKEERKQTTSNAAEKSIKKLTSEQDVIRY